jgi:hypothetical protein
MLSISGKSCLVLSTMELLLSAPVPQQYGGCVGRWDREGGAQKKAYNADSLAQLLG